MIRRTMPDIAATAIVMSLTRACRQPDIDFSLMLFMPHTLRTYTHAAAFA